MPYLNNLNLQPATDTVELIYQNQQSHEDNPSTMSNPLCKDNNMYALKFYSPVRPLRSCNVLRYANKECHGSDNKDIMNSKCYTPYYHPR